MAFLVHGPCTLGKHASCQLCVGCEYLICGEGSHLLHFELLGENQQIIDLIDLRYKSVFFEVFSLMYIRWLHLLRNMGSM